MTMSFQATFKTWFCLSLSLLMASSVAASEVCDDINSARATLVKLNRDPQPVTDNVTVSASAVFGFPKCFVRWTENDLNMLEYVCEYGVELPSGGDEERVINAQDMYLSDLVAEIKTCAESKETETNLAGFQASDRAKFMTLYFDDDSVLTVDVGGWIGQGKYNADVAMMYVEKRWD